MPQPRQSQTATAAARRPRRHAASARRSSRSRPTCSGARATSTASGPTWRRRSASARRRCTTTSSPSCTASTRSWPRRWRPIARSSSGSPRSTTTSSSALDGRAPGRVRPHRARGPAQPAARVRAGARRRAPHVGARGGGAPAGAVAHARPRVRVGDVPDARDGAGRDPRGRPAAARRARSSASTTASSTGTARGGDLALADVGGLLRPRAASPSRGCRWTWPAQARGRGRRRQRRVPGPPAADGQAATGSR